MVDTVEDIVDWMRREPDLLGWDVIAAVDITELDPGLAEAHLLRWRNGLDIGAIEGNFQIGDIPVFHYVSGLRPGAVRVDVGFNNPLQPEIGYYMDVEGGTRTVVEMPNKIRSLSRFDLLNPAQLQSRTPLREDGGQLLIDTSTGEEYKFDLRLGGLEQLEGGRFFQEKLKEIAWSDQERVRFVIAGTPESIENSFLSTQRIAASSWASADGKRVALLLLVALTHGASGGQPSPESGFPFPLPEEVAKDGRGTLLLNLKSMQRAALGHALERLLEGGAFEYQRQVGDGKLAVMKATAGSLRILPADYRSRAFNFESQAFELNAIGLEVDFQGDELYLDWQQDFAVKFTYWPSGTADRKTYTPTFRLNLVHQFKLFHDSEQQHLTRGQYFSVLRKEAEVELISGLPVDIDRNELAQIYEFIAYAITRGVYRAIASQLSARTPEHLMSQLQLADLRHLVDSQAQVEAPNNLAVFAPVTSPRVQFSIIQQNVLLKPGEKMHFTLNTEVPNVIWTREPLPGSSGEWGTIDPSTGEFTAPLAYKMGPLETRVLVVATDPATNAQSVSKVTVLTKSVSVNPLIHVTQVKADGSFKVPLTAGALGGGPLDWELVGSDHVGGSLDGDATGPTNTYTPPGEPAADTTFTIDEVRVTSKLLGESSSSLILVEHKSPGLRIVISTESEPEFGVQLEAWLNSTKLLKGVTWTLHPASPGDLDEQGLYTPDVSALEHFALISAEVAIEPLGTFAGYIILPLPLNKHKDVRALLTAVSANGIQQH